MGGFRHALASIVWHRALRPILFWFQPETAHQATMQLFAFLIKVPGCRWLTTAFFRVDDPCLRVCRFGLEFQNPVGLAAGLDKDGLWCGALEALGFGFVEVGTVTAVQQGGNPKPRLFRLLADQAVLNRMGSPNQGAAAMAGRLPRHSPRLAVLGINIGKTAVIPNESAASDYLRSFEQLYPFARYFALNISSPNTPTLRALQAKDFLAPLLRTIMDRNAALAKSRREKQRPLLVKIAPDLDDGQLDEIVELCLDLQLDGIIVANTTTSREGLMTPDSVVKSMGNGGISGLPLTLRSRTLVAAVYRKSQGTLPIIGVGGIMTEEDAWQMIRAGASLVQVHSGLIFRGPGFVAAIKRHLVKRLSESGKSSIDDVIGEANKPLTPGGFSPALRLQTAVPAKH